jgi:hypothetical protein
LLALVAVLAGVAVSLPAPGGPVLYSKPYYQSPHTARAGELLLLQGEDLGGVRRVTLSASGAAPATQPRVVEILGADPDGRSLVVRLPSPLDASDAIELRPIDASGQGGTTLVLNQLSPLWFTPASVAALATDARPDRLLKVVGYNFAAGATRRLELRLRSVSATYRVMAATQADTADRVLYAELPAKLDAGSYDVAVSRDGNNWVSVQDQRLEVTGPLRPATSISLAQPAAGGCRPDDGRDDAACFELAARLLREAGGGIITVPAGRWRIESRLPLILPRNVSLRGEDPTASRVERSAAAPLASPAFVLEGGNTIERLTLADERHYAPVDTAGPFFQLGTALPEQAPERPTDAVRNVEFRASRFEGTFVAIATSAVSVHGLQIIGNQFAAYRSAIELGANRFAVGRQFRLTDLIVRGNLFMPGSRLDLRENSASVATQIGAGERVDFSDNVAEGSLRAGLYQPSDPPGWRAAFFWNLGGPQERLLIARNVVTCPGDIIGDGEAIALDNNGNTFGYASAAPVTAATAGSVTADGPLQTSQFDRPLPSSDYYRGHWVQVGSGPGVGQTRRIRAVSHTDRGQVRLEVEPDWDVVPEPGQSQIAIGRQFWQVAVLGNRVDQRDPPCAKRNRTAPKGGAIALWAQMSDVAVVGNRQFDTDGILFQQFYSVQDENCPSCGSQTHFFDAIEIRGNRIEGEYDRSSACSSSGIMGSMGASPTPRHPPLTVASGIDIADNLLVDVDLAMGGMITVAPTWHAGPAQKPWPLVKDLVIQGNELAFRKPPHVRACRGAATATTAAINVEGRGLVRGVHVFANRCEGWRGRPVQISGSAGATVHCPADLSSSCGCNP